MLLKAAKAANRIPENWVLSESDARWLTKSTRKSTTRSRPSWSNRVLVAASSTTKLPEVLILRLGACYWLGPTAADAVEREANSDARTTRQR